MMECGCRTRWATAPVPRERKTEGRPTNRPRTGSGGLVWSNRGGSIAAIGVPIAGNPRGSIRVRQRGVPGGPRRIESHHAMRIRDLIPDDEAVVRELISLAFKAVPVSRQTEAAIHAALRAAGAARVALVAEAEGEVVGQIDISPVTIGGIDRNWLGVGPIAVRPDRQGRGLGRALVLAGMARARALGADGLVLVGDPAFYRRFGFAPKPGLTHEGVPDRYVMAASFGSPVPTGAIRFHPAFAAE